MQITKLFNSQSLIDRKVCIKLTSCECLRWRLATSPDSLEEKLHTWFDGLVHICAKRNLGFIEIGGAKKCLLCCFATRKNCSISLVGGKLGQTSTTLLGRVISAHEGGSKSVFLGDSGIRRSDLLFLSSGHSLL